ncbi:unnamed protein product [Adineta steineri]|uniref:NAD(P)(+)--arginine ADP-ribosyltransferase n=1 Tax=Adineta steineri TaxID=433720 RepID=A0A815LFR6_9BILA|nr:unnamed protein product [Adineta steineri]CAF1409349.1 unnamed protein product [Adineta steineri]
MTDESSHAYRFSDIAGESNRRLPPIRGFENMPLVSLEEATQPLIAYVPEIDHMVYTVKGNITNPKHDLTIDESASIALYSLEWFPRENSFYIILNETLRGSNRAALLPPWFKFLKLFLTALSKLPPITRRAIYRGVKLDLRKQYTKGTKIVWWGFSSCTSSIEVLENEQFFGKTGTRTLFTIECDNGKDIRKHSFHQAEDEILLLPGQEFEVHSSLDMGNNFIMIQLKEIIPRFPNIASIKTSKSSATTTTTMTTTTSTISIAAMPSLVLNVVPELKPYVESREVSYKDRKITDTDIQRIINEALIQQQCTELNLSKNKITHEGAAVLAKALRTNMALTTLHLGYNQIGEKGAQHLADSLRTNTTLTTLHLGYNQIGEKGAQHLADSLRTNTTLTTLSLSFNQIERKVLDRVNELIQMNKRLAKS